MTPSCASYPRPTPSALLLEDSRLKSSCFLVSGLALSIALPGALILPQIAQSQQSYRNVINQRFRTVSNGPQSGIIVDVADPEDVEGVHRAIAARVSATMRVHTAQLSREIAVLRQRHLLKDSKNSSDQMPLVEVVRLRSKGRLVSPKRNRANTRAVPGGNDLQISIATQGQFGFSTSSKTYNALSKFLPSNAQGLYPELKKILGSPFSSLPVNILNQDPDDAKTNISVRGVVVVYDMTNQVINIQMPTFSSDQDTFLGLAQALTQAFYISSGAGINSTFGYDAYTQGIARATACIAAQDLSANGFFAGFGASLDPIDPVSSFFYTPYYDLLNQQALGTSSFFPPTPSAAPVAGLGGMLVPRLQMASTVWTKCYIEDPSFFVKFNNAYYNAVTADPTVANNASRLRDLAANVLPTVEGLPFPLWYEQQYILDTSVTPGPKLFAYVQPTFPDSLGSAGASALLVYYATAVNGDEKALSGVVNPIYFDYSYTSRLTLSNGNAQETINNGLASASPFFTGIGDPKTGDDKQRLAIDFPVSSSQPNVAQPGGNEYARVYFPANEESISGKPTDFSGVYVGALTGSLSVSFNGGSGNLQSGAGINGIGFGAFSGTDPGGFIPTGFHKATLSFTPKNGTAPLIFQRNTFTRKDNTATPTIPGVSPVFVLNTGLSQASLTQLKHTFTSGAQMVALPFQPYQPYTSNLPLLFSLAPGTPDRNAPLIAQYRQDADPSVGNYLRFPSLPPYQPGFSFWTNFQGTVNNADLTTAGEPTDNKDVISVPLQFGWNMIGNPYLAPLTIDPTANSTTPGIQVQYLNGDALTLQEAINAGYVAAGIFGYNTATGGYQDITVATPGGLAQNIIQSWTGYWLRVMVTEGVTITYINPTPLPANPVGGGRALNTGLRNGKISRSSHLHLTSVSEIGGWRVPIIVRDSSGNAASALLGQSPRGSDAFLPALDAASPPPFQRAANLSLHFPHSDWDTGKASTGTGEFLSDIRRSGISATWNVVVNTPKSEQPYILNWNNTSKLPRGMRLTLIDQETGTRQMMNTSVSYTFTPSRGVTTRKFQILAEPRLPGRLFVNNLHVETRLSRSTAASALISYEVSGASEANVEIHSGTGRVIRHLSSGRAVSTGANQVLWDLKDDQGRTLAAGTYMIQITVRTPEGEQARSIIAHPITR